jgi:hypothetical protein
VGDWIDVPQDSLNPIWVKVTVDESPLARIVGLIYKPSGYIIEVSYKNGNTRTFKFIPTMAATGFLFNPLILNNHDAMAVRSSHEYQQYINDSSQTLNKVVKFKISCDQQKSVCGQQARVSFEKILGLTLGNKDELHKFYRFDAQQFGFDAELMDYQVANPVYTRSAFNEIFYQFHAPSQIKLFKPNGVQNLTAFYGMHPTTYSPDGAPAGVADGVLLSIRLETETGKKMLLFERDLNPFETPGDRGEQFLALKLPNESGTLYIEANPKKNAAFDQFLIRKISVQS